MNWKQGFFRLWIVFAVLWTGAVAGVSYMSIGSPSVERRAFVFPDTWPLERHGRNLDLALAPESRVEPLVFTDGTPDFPALRYAATAGDLVTIRLDARPNVLLYVASGTERSEIERRVDIVDGIVERVQAAVTARRRELALASVYRFGIFPSLVVLAIGTAFGWALAGFRKVRGGVA